MEDLGHILNDFSLAICKEFNAGKELKITTFEDDFCLNITGIIKRNFDNLEKINKFIAKLDNEIFAYLVIENKGCYFLNIILKTKYINKFLEQKLYEHKLFDKKHEDKKIIIDYASPNIAKNMHVGHMRSIFIGDTLANLMSYLSYDVVRINHLGDFGLQFGMIINYIITNNIDINEIKGEHLQNIYTNAKKSHENNKDFEAKSYEIIRILHLGDNTSDDYTKYYKIWKCIYDISYGDYKKLFEMLDVKQIDMGESYYKPYIPEMIADAISYTDTVYHDDGRLIATINKKDVPLTLLKSDGSYTYGTTDLCALKYRINVQKANEILYVVDNAQAPHFNQLFGVAKKIGIVKDQKLHHINFGIVLGSDGKRIRSSNGDTPKFIDLINECITKVRENYKEKGKTADEQTIVKFALSTLRYANLSISRKTDIRINYDEMMSVKGNTYAYALYAYVRCVHILENTAKYMSHNNDNKLLFTTNISSDDYKLAKHIIKYPYYLKLAHEMFDPQVLNEYIFKLFDIFQHWYTNTRVLEFSKDNTLEAVNLLRIEIIKYIEKLTREVFEIFGLSILTEM